MAVSNQSEKSDLRKQYGKIYTFEECMEAQRRLFGLPFRNLSLNDHLELAELYYEGRPPRLQPNFQMSMYYVGCIFAHFWKGVETYIPNATISADEFDSGMRNYFEGKDMHKAKNDLTSLADAGCLMAIRALGEVCGYLDEGEEARKWLRIDSAINPIYDTNPSSLYMLSIKGHRELDALHALIKLMKERKASPAFPESLRLYQLLNFWLIRFLEYESSQGNGYAMFTLYWYYHDLHNKKKAESWLNQACYSGFAPAQYHKYNILLMEEMNKMNSGRVDGNNLSLAMQFGTAAYQAGIKKAKPDMKLFAKIREVSNTTLRASVMADMKAEGILEQYREKHDSFERLFNTVLGGIPLNSEELSIYGMAMQDTEIAQASTMEMIARDMDEHEFLRKEMYQREEARRQEFRKDLWGE